MYPNNGEKFNNPDIKEVFKSLYNPNIPQTYKSSDKSGAHWGFTYNQNNDGKGGSASLGYGIAISEDSMVIGMPIFNKLQHHKIGGFMKVTNEEYKFKKFNSEMNVLRNKLKISTVDSNGNLKNGTKRSENFDISNAYLGWSILKGITYQ